MIYSLSWLGLTFPENLTLFIISVKNKSHYFFFFPLMLVIMQRFRDWLSENPAPHFLQLFGLSTIVVSTCLSRLKVNNFRKSFYTVFICKWLFIIMCSHMVLKVNMRWNSYSIFIAYNRISFYKCFYYEVVFGVFALLCKHKWQPLAWPRYANFFKIY